MRGLLLFTKRKSKPGHKCYMHIKQVLCQGFQTEIYICLSKSIFIIFKIEISRASTQCDVACGCSFNNNLIVFQDTNQQSLHLTCSFRTGTSCDWFPEDSQGQWSFPLSFCSPVESRDYLLSAISSPLCFFLGRGGNKFSLWLMQLLARRETPLAPALGSLAQMGHTGLLVLFCLFACF